MPLSPESSVTEIMEALPIGEVYRLAHNHGWGLRHVISDHKNILLWFPTAPKPAKANRWNNSSWTDEQRAVEKVLERVVSWMQDHPVDVERFLIENSPRLAVDFATKGGAKHPCRFHPENEKRFFERCLEKPRFNKACVRYCDQYSLFAPNMSAIMLEAGFGQDRRFTSYIKKMQKLKRHAGELIAEFLRFKEMSDEISVKELLSQLDD